MAMRFGASTAFRSYQNRVRWLIGGISCLVLFLAGAIAYLALQAPLESSEAQASRDSLGNSVTKAQDHVEVLVASQRVEEGTPMSRAVFSVENMPVQTLPSGVVLARDRSMLSNYYAHKMITPGNILHYDDITKEKAATPFDIPPGYRASTILADAQQLAGGLVTPRSRVDVVFSYTDDMGRRMTSTLVRFAMVLSINGLVDAQERMSISGQALPVSLLVTEMDAKRIELARNYGKLSLLLVGKTEIPTADSGLGAISLKEIIGGGSEKVIEEPIYPGTLVVTDPRTGQQVTYKLTPRGWKRMP